MTTLAKASLLLALALAPLSAQVNMGNQKAEASLPFNLTTTDDFELPWRIAFLPDGRMLVTEKIGPVWLVSAEGKKIAPLANTPAVYWQRQNGMLGVYLSPNYATDQNVYLTYIEPGEYGGSQVLARGKLDVGRVPKIDDLEVIWRQMPRGMGGQAGGQIVFSPDGKYLYMTVGDRQRMTPAQDPNQPVGKILRLTLDGKPAPGNPNYGKTGAKTIELIDPPKDTEVAKAAPVVSKYTFPGDNMTPAETWASGFRAPYGLAMSPTGEIWEVEHGPRGGDELNLIEKGANYGWPVVSYGMNYNQVPIPSHDANTKFTEPVIYWNPVIAPGDLIFYTGKKAFPQWDGSAFVTGLGSHTITRLIMDGKGGAKAAERWEIGEKRIRDITEAPDGTLWLLEDANPGALIHVTPK
ncbi:MAG: PQQ-dependent sugar dehydrogenase [Bryobacterales bacterium]|nr:PQQ-dependent sugar dehydrogenase [Bryobacterales bacterium]